MAWNFKDEATIAKRQDDMFAKGVPYEESKQYAIDNKMTYWNWKSVKMYTWWKTKDSGNTVNFKDWAEFKNMVNSIDTSKMSEDDLKSLWEYIQSAKINWVTVRDLWLSWDELNKASAKKIDSTVKNINNNSAYNELMWYYDDEWYEDNMDIYNGILFSPTLTTDEKKEKLEKLSSMNKDTMMRNVDNAGDDISAIKEATEKNKEAWKLSQSINSNTTSRTLQKNKEHWLDQTRVNDIEKQITSIMTDTGTSDRAKYRKLSKLKYRIQQNYLGDITYELNSKYRLNNWNNAYTSTPEWKAAMAMYEDWENNWKSLMWKIDAYMDWLWERKGMDLWHKAKYTN